jgi:hypothetical protein
MSRGMEARRARRNPATASSTRLSGDDFLAIGSDSRIQASARVWSRAYSNILRRRLCQMAHSAS